MCVFFVSFLVDESLVCVFFKSTFVYGRSLCSKYVFLFPNENRTPTTVLFSSRFSPGRKNHCNRDETESIAHHLSLFPRPTTTPRHHHPENKHCFFPLSTSRNRLVSWKAPKTPCVKSCLHMCVPLVHVRHLTDSLSVVLLLVITSSREEKGLQRGTERE